MLLLLRTVGSMCYQLLQIPNAFIHMSHRKLNLHFLNGIFNFIQTLMQHVWNHHLKQGFLNLTIRESQHIAIAHHVFDGQIARLIKEQLRIGNADIGGFQIIHINETAIQFLHISFKILQQLRQQLGCPARNPKRLQTLFLQRAKHTVRVKNALKAL